MIYASSSVKDCTTEQVGIVIGENETSQVSGHDNGEAAAEQHLLLEEGDGRPGGEGGHLHHQIQVTLVTVFMEMLVIATVIKSQCEG